MAFWEKQDRSVGQSSCCHASLDDNSRLIPRTHGGKKPTPKHSPPTSTLMLGANVYTSEHTQTQNTFIPQNTHTDNE